MSVKISDFRVIIASSIINQDHDRLKSENLASKNCEYMLASKCLREKIWPVKREKSLEQDIINNREIVYLKWTCVSESNLYLYLEADNQEEVT